MDDATVQRDEWTQATLENPLGYSVTAVLEPKTSGCSVYIEQLPGVVSQGKDKTEALENITEACRLAIEVYKEQGLVIPWVKAQLPRNLRVGIVVPG